MFKVTRLLKIKAFCVIAQGLPNLPCDPHLGHSRTFAD